MIRRQLCRSLYRFLAFKPQPIVKIPVYNFVTGHGKKILDVWDLSKAQYVELTEAITECHTCRMVAELLKENIHQMTDYQLSFAIKQIYEYDIILDDNFYNIILPIVKEFVKNMDRESNKALGELVSYFGWMKVEDEGLWRLFEQKLVGEKLYRYIPLKELCKMIDALGTANQGSDELFNIFERVLLKHRLNLEPEDISYARKGFESRKVGSQVLFGVFEDPLQALPEGYGEPEKFKQIGH